MPFLLLHLFYFIFVLFWKSYLLVWVSNVEKQGGIEVMLSFSTLLASVILALQNALAKAMFPLFHLPTTSMIMAIWHMWG